MSERVVEVRSGAGDYAVRIGPGLLARLGALVREVAPKARIALVTDGNVRPRWGARAQQSLEQAGCDVRLFEVPPGEASKSLACADRLWGELISAGYARSDLLVAFGGGVVGDLAGFVAATFHRGMPFVQVPTTLLAQVDSSVGGKVAIDHARGKNLVGAFHPPRLVVADSSVLATLPARERWGGLAEMVKVGLIADPALLERLEEFLEPIAEDRAPPQVTANAIAAAIGVKASIVSQDEKETGMRMWLNFGHTVAHGLEAASGYGPLTHGEAVVIGMGAAVFVSEQLRKIAPADAERARAILARFPKPPRIPLDAQVVSEAMGKDKKAVGGRIRYIVLEGIGRASIEPELPRALLDEAIAHAVRELAGAAP